MSADNINHKHSFSIKAWSEDDRPREKLMQKGRGVLTDAELIAILIGSGSRDESAVALSKKILNSVGNDLDKLSLLSIQDLMKFKGIGEAKAIAIVSALELGRRRKNSQEKIDAKISSSSDAHNILFPYLADLDHEQFYVVLLKRNNALIDVVKVSQGGVSSTLVDAKMIFKICLERLASSIILAHNHPSGNLQPSQSDIQLTKRICEGSKLLDTQVVDHLILGGKTYFSFADNGLL